MSDAKWVGTIYKRDTDLDSLRTKRRDRLGYVYYIQGGLNFISIKIPKIKEEIKLARSKGYNTVEFKMTYSPRTAIANHFRSLANQMDRRKEYVKVREGAKDIKRERNK